MLHPPTRYEGQLANDIAALTLQIATARSEDVVRAIGELLSLELGVVRSSQEDRVAQVQISGASGSVTLSIGNWSPVSIGRNEAISCLREGRCLVSWCIERWLGEDLNTPCSIDDAWRQRSVIESGEPRITFVSSDPVVPVSEHRLNAVISKTGSAVLVGPSSSGKTVTLATLRKSRLDDGCSTLWVDLSNPAVSPVGFISAIARLMKIPDCPRPLVVLDDLQSAPNLGRTLLRIWTECGVDADLVVGCWPDALDVVETYIPSVQHVRCDGTQTCRRLIEKVRADHTSRENLLALASGDALVAELSADIYAKTGCVPATQELAIAAHKAITGRNELNASEHDCLFEIACLGMFEIDAKIELLPPARRCVVKTLQERRILRQGGDYVRLGHRSLARLVVRHYQSFPNQRECLTVRLVVDYLRKAGEVQIRQTLDRLDLVTVTDGDDQFGAAFLAQCWYSLRILVRQLSQQVSSDPTWGDNTASAIFAADAFAELGMLDEWRSAAKYIRTRWIVDDNEQLPRPTSDDTAETDDFREIQRKMVEEDEALGGNIALPSVEVDVDRFHRNWMLGLLLGFERKALEPDVARLKRLKAMAASSQSSEGSYYPRRVPWITARILIGLSQCGDSLANSDILRLGADWLRSRPPLGPCSFGVWRSGTGTWNTDIETTAIVLLALGRIGISTADRSVRAGLEFLRSGRSEWYKPGKEIDCAQSIEAALVLGASWRDFGPELRTLLRWAQDSRSWDDARSLASVVQDESSKVPLVTSALITIIWETVRAELPLLLQSVAGDTVSIDAVPRKFPAWADVAAKFIDRLEREIADQVRDREALLARKKASNEVRLALVSWRARQKQLDVEKSRLTELIGRWDRAEAAGVTEAINALGSAVLGEAWDDLWDISIEQ